jgi:hypothetical protein
MFKGDMCFTFYATKEDYNNKTLTKKEVPFTNSDLIFKQNREGILERVVGNLGGGSCNFGKTKN